MERLIVVIFSAYLVVAAPDGQARWNHACSELVFIHAVAFVSSFNLALRAPFQDSKSSMLTVTAFIVPY